MSLRKIEVTISEKYRDDLMRILEGYDYLDLWQGKIDNGRVHTTSVLPTEKTEEILDIIEKRFSNTEGFRIILVSVEASIPRLEVKEKKEPEDQKNTTEKKIISKTIFIPLTFIAGVYGMNFKFMPELGWKWL